MISLLSPSGGRRQTLAAGKDLQASSSLGRMIDSRVVMPSAACAVETGGFRFLGRKRGTKVDYRNHERPDLLSIGALLFLFHVADYQRKLSAES